MLSITRSLPACAFFLGAAVSSANANEWQICRMELKINGIITQPYSKISAEVQSVKPETGRAECPLPGDEITFVPELADYQSPVPRNNWPKAGQLVRWRYIYLDGICKGDGNSHPCRIQHYPEGWK